MGYSVMHNIHAHYVNHWPWDWVNGDVAWLAEARGEENGAEGAVKGGHLDARPLQVRPVQLPAHPVHRYTRRAVHTSSHQNLATT